MFINKKKYLNMVLNKRQMILCKTPLEAMKLMDYLTYLGYL